MESLEVVRVVGLPAKACNFSEVELKLDRQAGGPSYRFGG